MSKVLTIREIAQGSLLSDKPLDQVKRFMKRQRTEHGYLIVHLPDPPHKSLIDNSVVYGAVIYADEVWLIRQIGAARCIKHRFKRTPFEQLF